MEAAFPRTAVMVPTCWTFPAPTIRRRSRFECIKPSTSHRTGDRSIHHDAENDPSRKFLQTMICIISLPKCFGQLEIFELHSFIIFLWFYQKIHMYYMCMYVFLICVCFWVFQEVPHRTRDAWMQGYLDHAKSRPRFLPTMSVPPRQKRTPEGVQRHTKNVSSNFNSMVLALRLLYGAVKTLHIWHHLAD